jgi:RNA ligase
MTLHPARQYSFRTLFDALQTEIAAGNVYERIGPNGLRLYCYTNRCVYERAWNATNQLARGLILDVQNQQVVATPFPKFFNLGEHAAAGRVIPDEEFEVFEKLDGSLIILFCHQGLWRAATKGSFVSDQAAWAISWVSRHNVMNWLTPGVTYLYETIYPANRIVVPYDYEGLSLLAAYDADGKEWDWEIIREHAFLADLRCARRQHFASMSDLILHAKRLPADEEGFVIRFASGLRLKIKGDEYCRLHRLISGITPLAIWEMLKDNRDIEETRREIPEEFWGDFDRILDLLVQQAVHLVQRIEDVFVETRGLSDKELGLKLPELPDDVRPFIFSRRKKGIVTLWDARSRESFYKTFRPCGNHLDGYVPSGKLDQVLAEA